MPRPALSNDAVDAMRQHLAGAALAIYRQAGLDALSFRRLADATGNSHTLVYRYFDDKEALLARMRADCFNSFEGFVRAREQPDAGMRDHIHSVARAYVDFAETHRADYLLMFSTEQPSPDRYPELLGARRSLFEHVVSLVDHYIRAGEIRGGARQLAHAFWINLHGLMTLHAAGQLVHGCTLEELVDPIIDRLIDGGVRFADSVGQTS